MKTKACLVGFWALLFLVAFYGYTHRGESKPKEINRAGLFEPPTNKAFEADMAELAKTPQSAETNISEGYRLVVGANPRLGTNQHFSPPAGSVEVTNEAQLASLIEQAKAARKQKQTVQQ